MLIKISSAKRQFNVGSRYSDKFCFLANFIEIVVKTE